MQHHATLRNQETVTRKAVVECGLISYDNTMTKHKSTSIHLFVKSYQKIEVTAGVVQHQVTRYDMGEAYLKVSVDINENNELYVI